MIIMITFEDSLIQINIRKHVVIAQGPVVSEEFYTIFKEKQYKLEK